MNINISLILTLVVLAFVVFRILWGFVRGLKGQRIRTIMILSCALVAVIETLLLRDTVLTDSTFSDAFVPLLDNVASGALSGFAAGSAIYSALAGLSVSLIAPIFCLIVFLVLSIITWIVYAILFLCLRRRMKESDESASARHIRFIGLSVAEAIIVIAIWALPVVYYSDLATDVIDTVQSQEWIENKDTLDTIDQYVSEVHGNFLVRASGALGGRALSNRLSVITFTANGETVETHLKDELDSSLTLVGKVMKLKGFNMNSLSSKEVDAFKGIADSFADSKLLSAIVCEGLHSATDAWSKGNEFAGISKPNLGGGEGDVAEMMDSLFDIISNDTKSVDLLKKDLYTVADFMDVIIKYGAMDAFSSGDVASLASVIGTTIDGDDILTAMNKVLSANDSFAPIYEKLNSIVDSVKAQAFEQIFGITGEEAEALVEKTEEIFGDVADTINSIDKNKPLEDQKAELSSALEDIIRANAAEVDVTIEGVDIGAVSDSVAAEFLENPDKYENVSQEDIKAYILQYASGQIQ